MRNKPRELYLTTYQNPEPAVVYDMAKCHPDFFTKEQQWHLIEYSAYQALLQQAESMAEALDSIVDWETYVINKSMGSREILYEVCKDARDALKQWKEFKNE